MQPAVPSLALPEQVPATPKRPSQVVNESTASSQTGQHIVILMDRVSTGGTRHVAQFHRQTDGPMSAAERAKKKRVRASLFPKEHAVARSLDATRKREAKERAAEDSDAANDWQRQMTPTTAEKSLQSYRSKVVQSCMEWMLCAVEQAIAEDSVDRIVSTVQLQHVYQRGTWMYV
jgi:hypothetical protein